MNKSRASLAVFARRVAAKGHSVVIPDLWGTGDSEGDFRDASLRRWRDNLTDVCAWFRSQGGEFEHIVNLRFGSLLTVDWLAHSGPQSFRNLICIQPILQGTQAISQWLRLASSGRLLAEKSQPLSPKDELQTNGIVNCGGYELSRQLATDIEPLRLVADSALRLHLFEVKGRGDSLSPALQKVQETTDNVGLGGVISAPPFWTSTEIVHVDLASSVLPCMGSAS